MRNLDAIETIVGDLDSLDTHAVPQHSRPADVDVTARDRDDAVAPQIGIGQVGLEQRVVGADRRAQEQRLLTVQEQLEAREESSAVVVEAFFTRLLRHDVATRVEHAERVAVLEHT